MSFRLILYLVFFILKNFCFSLILSRLKASKALGVSFAPSFFITSFSETACFLFLPQVFNLGYAEPPIFSNVLICICCFCVSALISSVLMFFYLRRKNSLLFADFLKLILPMLGLCMPYLFLFPIGTDNVDIFTFSALLIIFLPIFASTIFTNLFYTVYIRVNKIQKGENDFRLKEIICSFVSGIIGLLLTALIPFVLNLRFEKLFYANTLESVLLPCIAFSVSVLINLLYLNIWAFGDISDKKSRNFLNSLILSILNAPYIFLLPIFNSVLVNNGVSLGMSV